MHIHTDSYPALKEYFITFRAFHITFIDWIFVTIEQKMTQLNWKHFSIWYLHFVYTWFRRNELVWKSFCCLLNWNGNSFYISSNRWSSILIHHEFHMLFLYDKFIFNVLVILCLPYYFKDSLEIITTNEKWKTKQNKTPNKTRFYSQCSYVK